MHDVMAEREPPTGCLDSARARPPASGVCRAQARTSIRHRTDPLERDQAAEHHVLRDHDRRHLPRPKRRGPTITAQVADRGHAET